MNTGETWLWAIALFVIGGLLAVASLWVYYKVSSAGAKTQVTIYSISLVVLAAPFVDSFRSDVPRWLVFCLAVTTGLCLKQLILSSISLSKGS